MQICKKADSKKWTEDYRYVKRIKKKEVWKEVKAQDVQGSMLSSYIYHGPIKQEETGAH